MKNTSNNPFRDRKVFWVTILSIVGFLLFNVVVSAITHRNDPEEVRTSLVKSNIMRIMEVKGKDTSTALDVYDNPIQEGMWYYWNERINCSFAPVDLSGKDGLDVGLFNDLTKACDTIEVVTCYNFILKVEMFYFEDPIQISRGSGNGVRFK